MEINTNMYQWNYGKRPKGIGFWWFKICVRDQVEVEVSYSGEYRDVLKKVKKYCKDQGLKNPQIQLLT